jgi:hypothetical protein
VFYIFLLVRCLCGKEDPLIVAPLPFSFLRREALAPARQETDCANDT